MEETFILLGDYEMKKPILSLILLVMLLIGSSTLFFRPRTVLAYSGSIYIRSDGTIDPPDGRIVTDDNVTYTLVYERDEDVDYPNSIVNEKDDIILDGAWRFAMCTLNMTDRRNVTITRWNIHRHAQDIEIRNSSKIEISNNLIGGFSRAITLIDCSDSIVNDNTLGGSYEYGVGIRLISCSNITICRNRIVYSDEIGIDLVASSNNTIYDNSIRNHYTHSLSLTSSFNNDIFRNDIVDTHWDSAIIFISSSNNKIHANNFTNAYFGLTFGNSSGNEIYYNTFVNIKMQAAAGDSNNTWNCGYLQGGNFWNNYTGTDGNSDGIGDTPYVLYANNSDNSPLMGRFSDFSLTADSRVQTVCNFSISNFQFNGTAIAFKITGANNTTGFCRISIPTIIVNNTYKVLLNNEEISYNLLPCSDSTHSYLYFTFDQPIQEVVIIPERPTVTFYIKADGHIVSQFEEEFNHTNLPLLVASRIQSLDNFTYTLSPYPADSSPWELYEHIIVERNDVVLNGENCGFYGDKGSAILLARRTNVTIRNFTIVGSFDCGIEIRGSIETTVFDNNINVSYGIRLVSSSGTGIFNNTIRTGEEGIEVVTSTNNTISENKISPRYTRIGLFSSPNNTIRANEISEMLYYGIRIKNSPYNTIIANKITHSFYEPGIKLYYSSNNEICGNELSICRIGIALNGSSQNTICHNNFTKNRQQVENDGSVNTWDDGYPSGGNCWSDYFGADTNADGIGDVPYIIDESNVDHFPNAHNVQDIDYLISMFNTRASSSIWNQNADVNNDHVVNMRDITRAFSQRIYLIIQPNVTAVRLGETFTVNVVVCNCPNLWKWQVTLDYGGHRQLFGGKSGNPLFQLTLKAETAGTSDIIFVNPWPNSRDTFLLDHNNNSMPFTAIDGRVKTLLTLNITCYGGTTNPSPGSYTYDKNTVVTVTAIKTDPESIFRHWLLDGTHVGEDNPINVTMNKNHVLDAVFG
jgi:parallel beta-helix repeat protein